MTKMIVVSLALALYWTNAVKADPVDVPAECKNLAVMQTQLLQTQFHNDNMGGGTYNPSQLTLQSNGGYQIGKIDYLGGDGEDTDGPNAGKYPCDTNPSLCTNAADAGGSLDWARVHVNSAGANPYEVAQVVVSMGGRGGCTISSALVPLMQ